MRTGVETIANFTKAKSEYDLFKNHTMGREAALLKTPWRTRVSVPSTNMSDAERLITFG